MHPTADTPGPWGFRDATAADREFLTAMLSEAANWRPGPAVVGPDALRTDPHLRAYLEGWPRADDLGVIAFDPRDGRPVGAAWCRPGTADAHGYGHVADDVPEVSIAVVPDRRGRGIGAALLGRLIHRATTHDVRALSLSVEHDNPAGRLYRRFGFAVIDDTDGAATMLLDLDRTR